MFGLMSVSRGCCRACHLQNAKFGRPLEVMQHVMVATASVSVSTWIAHSGNVYPDRPEQQ